MTTLGTNALTLVDWAKRQDPNNKVARIVEMLAQTNEILLDIPYIEGNLPTGHRTTVRTGLPSVYWRMLNQGVATSKSHTAQIDEHIGMLEAYSECDVELAKLNGDVGAFRLSESSAFLEAMNQEMASTLFYGNASTAPEEFTGLATRYSAIGQNCIDAQGSDAANQTSIWLIVWGENTVTGVYPKASTVGIQHTDKGQVTLENAGGVTGARMEAYRDHYQWKNGIALRDWRYAVRVANIDVSNQVSQSSAAWLTELMIKAIHRIPNLARGNARFYMNRTMAQYLDIQRQRALTGAVGASAFNGTNLSIENIDGRHVPSFRGIPIRSCDAILETEDEVT